MHRIVIPKPETPTTTTPDDTGETPEQPTPDEPTIEDPTTPTEQPTEPQVQNALKQLYAWWQQLVAS